MATVGRPGLPAAWRGCGGPLAIRASKAPPTSRRQRLEQQIEAFEAASRQREPKAAERQLTNAHSDITPHLLLFDAAAQAAHVRCEAIIVSQMIEQGEPIAGYEQQVRAQLQDWLDSRQRIIHRVTTAADATERRLPSRHRTWMRGGLVAVRHRNQAAATISGYRKAADRAASRTKAIRDDLALLLQLGEPAPAPAEDTAIDPPAAETAALADTERR